jgi:hypothetical protein
MSRLGVGGPVVGSPTASLRSEVPKGRDSVGLMMPVLLYIHLQTQQEANQTTMVE